MRYALPEILENCFGSEGEVSVYSSGRVTFYPKDYETSSWGMAQLLKFTEISVFSLVKFEC